MLPARGWCILEGNARGCNTVLFEKRTKVRGAPAFMDILPANGHYSSICQLAKMGFLKWYVIILRHEMMCFIMEIQDKSDYYGVITGGCNQIQVRCGAQFRHMNTASWSKRLDFKIRLRSFVCLFCSPVECTRIFFVRVMMPMSLTETKSSITTHRSL